MTDTMKTTGLNFIEAVTAAKETGCKIRRASWRNVYFVIELCETGKDDNKYYTIYDDPYHFKQKDFEADDWEIVPAPKTIRLMSFVEAMAKVKEGYAVRRKEWVHSSIAKDNCVGIARLKTRGDDSKWVERFAPTFDEIEAADWGIVEEGQE